MTSQPVCCPPGSWGAAAPPAGYVPKGKTESLGPNLRAYVVRPSSAGKSNKAIIACQDIFGENSGRTKAICDDYAEKMECLVILPNFLENDEWKEEWGSPISGWNLPWFMAFCFRHRPSNVKGLYESDIKGFLAKEGVEMFATISFCWGALAAEALSTFPEARAHVSFHPSHGAYQISFDKPLKSALALVKCPQLFLVGNNDQVKPGDESEIAVREGAKQFVKVELFDEQVHGWVNRGDVSKPVVLRDVEKALIMACDFIKQYLK